MLGSHTPVLEPRREYLPRRGENQNQRHANQEGGHGAPEQRDDSADEAPYSSAIDRRQGAERDADREREQPSAEYESHRVPARFLDNARNGAFVSARCPQVALGDVHAPFQILNRRGARQRFLHERHLFLGYSVASADAFDDGERRERPSHSGYGEHDDCGAGERRQDEYRPANEILSHRTFPSLAVLPLLRIAPCAYRIAGLPTRGERPL